MENKKGQAALEFLMTYGWAILAAIIAIAALAYFGVFSPGKLVSDAFTLSAPLSAQAAVITDVADAADSDTVKIEFSQNLGEQITINGATVKGCTPAVAIVQTDATLDSGTGTNVVTITCEENLVKGNTFKGDVMVTYIKTTGEGTLSLQSTGSVTSKVR